MTTSKTTHLSSRLAAWPLVLSLASALGACATTNPVPVEGPREQSEGVTAAASSGGQPGEPVTPKLSARAQRLFDDAVEAEEEQRRLKVPTDWAALEKKWKAVLGAEDVPEAHYNLGVIYEHERRPSEARSEYERALRLKPTLRDAAVNLAVMMEGDGNSQAAIATYQNVIHKYPEDATARVRLASLYRAAGQLDEAWRLAREALARDPRAVGAYKVMMRVALERGNLSMAKLLALRGLKLDDRDPDLYFFVGKILLKEDDEPGAILQFKKALAQRDDFMPSRYELLRLALKKQNWEGVVEQSQRILRIDPKNAEMYLDLGIAYRYLNNGDKAIMAYDQAEKLSGDKLPATHLNRGIVYMKVKNLCEPALTEFQKAVNAGIPGESSVHQLQQECEQIVAANKQAEEAARQMKEEAERQKKEAAEKAAHPGATPPGPAGAKTAGPDREKDKGAGAQDKATASRDDDSGNDDGEAPQPKPKPTAAKGNAAKPQPKPVPAPAPSGGAPATDEPSD